MKTALNIHVRIREKWGRMAKAVVDGFHSLLGGRTRVRAMSLEDATPVSLAVNPLLTIQLSEEQEERVQELEEHGPPAR
jgi:hypothetical protein